jgi:hypothetical protein
MNGEKAVANEHAETGHRLLEATRHEDFNHHEEAKSFLTEDVPDYCKRVAALAKRPEAADLMAWIKEQAKDEDNYLFRILATQMA